MADIRLGSLNVVMMLGRVTMDPDLRYTPKGTAVLQFRIAVNRRYPDKATGEWKEETSFFTVVTWGQQAERIGEQMKKGSAVLIEGELRSRSWESKEGDKRSAVEIHGRRVQVLDRAGATGESRGGVQPEESDTGHEPGGDQLDDIPF